MLEAVFPEFHRLAALLSLGLAAPAHALTTLATPAPSEDGNELLVCRIGNEGTKAIAVM